MKKILIVVTNISKYETTNRATGLWLGEATHFIDPILKAGYEIEFVSPNGGYTPIDPHSLSSDFMTDIDWKYYCDSKFLSTLANSRKSSEINPDDYIAIYYTGGHGVIWDFPENKTLQDIAMKIYNNGGIVSGVCHGVAGLLNIKTNNGEYLIKGKKVTGFSNSEEKEVQLDHLVPYLTEDEMKKRGAIYVKGENWSSFAIEDSRVVTGQNPSSGKAVAEKVLEILKK